MKLIWHENLLWTWNSWVAMLDLSLDNWRIWYEKILAAIYLIPSDTKVLEIYLLTNTKKYFMMSSCMTKLEFLPEPYMLFRLEKLPLLCCLFALSLVKLCWPLWEVCQALKFKITNTHPHMHYSYNRGRRKNMPFHLEHPKMLH